jgi:hypothetical protein
LDVCALTDHDAFGVRAIDDHPEIWERIQGATDAANAPGRFVTFAAYEWTSWVYGHKHVLFPPTGPRTLCSSRRPDCATPDQLWKNLPAGAMTISHHPGGGPIGADWSFRNADRERLVEIASIHGVSESYGAPRSIYRPKRGSFVFDALRAGIRLGIIGGGDTHNGHPGMGDPSAPCNGLGAILAADRSRESVWAALLARRTYATTGARILLRATLNDRQMGADVPLAGGAGLLRVSAIGERDIVKTEVLRNGEAVTTHRDRGIRIEFDEPLRGCQNGDSVLVRVTQDDDQVAWSSPFWITGDK